MSSAAEKRKRMEEGFAEAASSAPSAARIAATPPAESGPTRDRVRLDGATFVIPIGRIRPDPDQPRKTFDPDEHSEMVASLKARGQLQAVRARKSGEDYLLVTGERRWRAAAEAGLSHLLVQVVPDSPPEEILADQLVENELRANMTPIDVAAAVHRLSAEFGWSSRQIVTKTGMSQSAVTRSIQVHGLPESVLDRVRDGRLSASAAAALSRLTSDQEKEELAREAVDLKLTRDDVELIVRERIAIAETGVNHGGSPQTLSKPQGQLKPLPEVNHGGSPQGFPKPPGHAHAAPEVNHGGSPQALANPQTASPSYPSLDARPPDREVIESPVKGPRPGLVVTPPPLDDDEDDGPGLVERIGRPGTRTVDIAPGVHLRFLRDDGQPITLYQMRDWVGELLGQLNQAIASDPRSHRR